jgi:Sec-independent protein translocase protein TatA
MNSNVSHSRIYLLTAVFILTAFTIAGTSCRLLKRDKQAMAEKKTEEADKKLDAEYESARKQHYHRQTKEAKKMMKNTEKQAAKFNKPKKRKTFSIIKCR